MLSRILTFILACLCSTLLLGQPGPPCFYQFNSSNTVYSTPPENYWNYASPMYCYECPELQSFIYPNSNKGIYRVNDTLLYLLSSFDIDLIDPYCPVWNPCEPYHGLIISRSINGGTTWQQLFSLDVSYRTYNVVFTNNLEGYIYYDNHILTTTDGGETWIESTTFQAPLLDLTIDASNTQYALIYDTNSTDPYLLYQKFENDASWAFMSSFQNVFYIPYADSNTSSAIYASPFEIQVSNSNIVIYIQQTEYPEIAGGFLLSRDSGNTWEFIDTGAFGGTGDIQFISESAAWGISVNRLYYTTDSWETITVFAEDTTSYPFGGGPFTNADFSLLGNYIILSKDNCDSYYYSDCLDLQDFNGNGTIDCFEECALYSGQLCNDSNDNTFNDVLQVDCSCLGTESPGFTVTANADRICDGSDGIFTITGVPDALVYYTLNETLDTIRLSVGGVGQVYINNRAQSYDVETETYILNLQTFYLDNGFNQAITGPTDTLVYYHYKLPSLITESSSFELCDVQPYVIFKAETPTNTTVHYSYNWPIYGNYLNELQFQEPLNIYYWSNEESNTIQVDSIHNITFTTVENSSRSSFSNDDSTTYIGLDQTQLFSSILPENFLLVIAIDSLNFTGCTVHLENTVSEIRTPSTKVYLDEYNVNCNNGGIVNSDIIPVCIDLMDYSGYRNIIQAMTLDKTCFQGGPDSIPEMEIAYGINSDTVRFHLDVNHPSDTVPYENYLLIQSIFSLNNQYTNSNLLGLLHFTFGENQFSINDTLEIQLLSYTGSDGCRNSFSDLFLTNSTITNKYLIHPAIIQPAVTTNLECLNNSILNAGEEIALTNPTSQSCLVGYNGPSANWYFDQLNPYSSVIALNSPSISVSQPGTYFSTLTDPNSGLTYITPHIVNEFSETPCDDGNPCTENDLIYWDCSCIGIYTDTDNDGICNGLDSCDALLRDIIQFKSCLNNFAEYPENPTTFSPFCIDYESNPDYRNNLIYVNLEKNINTIIGDSLPNITLRYRVNGDTLEFHFNDTIARDSETYQNFTIGIEFDRYVWEYYSGRLHIEPNADYLPLNDTIQLEFLSYTTNGENCTYSFPINQQSSAENIFNFIIHPTIELNTQYIDLNCDQSAVELVMNESEATEYPAGLPSCSGYRFGYPSLWYLDNANPLTSEISSEQSILIEEPGVYYNLMCNWEGCMAYKSAFVVSEEFGQPCDDNDPCTVSDVILADCSCAGTFADVDNDGTCDALDVCPITASASSICAGDAVTLSVNNGQASPIQNAFDPLVYNNFIFSAINPATSKRTIWKKTTLNSAYTPLFNDNYNRVQVSLGNGNNRIAYVRYKSNLPNGASDSAWVCTSNLDGFNETIHFIVPNFTRDDVTSLDWSNDNSKLVLTLFNDLYPTTTRDGDVFTYTFSTNTLTNLTNDFSFYNNMAVVQRGTNNIIYNRNETEWVAWNILLYQMNINGGTPTQIVGTGSYSYPNSNIYPTDANQNFLYYRRGGNQGGTRYLYRKNLSTNTENIMVNVQGRSGIEVDDTYIAWLDFANDIRLWNMQQQELASFDVSSITNFDLDAYYRQTANDNNFDLQWLGKWPTNTTQIIWSTGESAPVISVNPSVTSTYSVTIIEADQTCSADITIEVNQPSSSTIDAAITAGETYNFNGQPVTTAGSYEVVLVNAAGCDSTVTLSLTVNPPLNCEIAAVTTSICSGESVELSISNVVNSAVCASNQLPAGLQNGLVTYLPFCGNANDASGNEHNGLVNGATLTADRFGEYNSAYSFQSSTIKVVPFQLLGQAFSFNFWIKPTNILNASTSRQDLFVLSFGACQFYYVQGRLRLELYNQNHQLSQYDYITNIASSEWSNLGLSIQAGGSVELYFNGVKVILGNAPAVLQSVIAVAPGLQTVAGSLLLGHEVSYVGPFYYAGQMDDFFVYNRTLTTEEQQQLYAAPGEALQPLPNGSAVQWSTGDTTPSIVATPTTNTTYVATVNSGMQTCLDSVTVVVLPNETYYSDADGDGFGNFEMPHASCEGLLEGYTLDNTDCDDSNAAVFINASCNDNNPCTMNDLIQSDCTCAGTFADTDNDGTCDANDLCAGPETGTACDDNDACTINDVIQSDCICSGTFADTDSDGTCDANDLCLGPEPGTACDDNNPCTVNDIIQSDCTCAGTFADADSDGTCDANDLCVGPEPGAACDDNDPCTVNDLIQSDCTCAGTFADADSDGTCDANDLCLGPEPGATCNDNDPCTVNDLIQSDCTCAGTFADADSDGTCDANDLCLGPEPGAACDDNDACTINDLIQSDCTCAGTFADTDNDGTCDANDLCVGPEPGAACDDNDPCTVNDLIQSDCTCAGTFADADFDGTCDANDLCSGGPEPGSGCDDRDDCTVDDMIQADCSCAGVYIDSDADGTCDAFDICANSPEPGMACNDGNPCTINDTVNASCECVGTPVETAVSVTTIHACEPYTWNGQTYAVSGNYTFATQTALGCDSLARLALTVGTPTFSSQSVTSCGSYTWNGTSYSQSGTYTYVTTNNTGCPNTATLNLTVNTPSTAASSVAASANNVNAGTSVTLTMQGGSLGTGASWKWYRGSCGGTLVGTGASITLTANVTDTYFVRAEGTCNTTTCVPVTVTVLSGQCGPELVSASSTRICSGSSTTLSVLGTLYPGAIWRWRRNSCSGTIVGTGANLVVTPTATTTYYVRAEGGTCGITLCLAITIVVDKMPATPSVISGPTTGLCNAQNVTYSVTPVSTVQQYNWTVPPGITIVSGQGTASVTVNVSNFINTNPTNGNPAICVTAQNSCGISPIRCLSLTTYPATPASISGTATPCINTVNTYSCPTVYGATSYSWTVPTGWVIQSGQGTSSISVLCNGTSGNVRVRSINACGNSTFRTLACAPRACGTTAMPMQLELWPNPTSDRVFMAHGDAIPTHMQIYDMLGRDIYNGPWVPEYDVSGLAGGIYFVRATGGGKSVVKRLEVVR